MGKIIRPLANLHDRLRRLPGLGSKSAMRLAYKIIDMPMEEVERLADAILVAKRDVHLCKQCYNLTADEYCEICNDVKRDRSMICVVEQPPDVTAMERSQGYKGLYHVLHGVMSPLDGIGPDQLRLKELFQRLETEEAEEVIIATNSDVEGEATASYLAQLLKPTGIKVSRIAQGLPMGGDLEFADELTLAQAVENRRRIC
ncbi:MAG: recombination mediator RecR [Phascolarctobacterium sp.]|nr:recombination mediator RecR [Phascolarctobacterium sp.]